MAESAAWPSTVKGIYEHAVSLVGEQSMLYGPGHIVWGDHNYDCAEWCIEHAEQYRGALTDHEYDVVLESLRRLAAIPPDQRETEE